MKFILSVVAVSVLFYGRTQQTLDDVLKAVEENNPILAVKRQLVSAQQLENHTGLTPENPFIQTDYMIGRPVSGGNQLDLLATQRLDFPTVYSRRKKVASQKDANAEYAYLAERQRVLLEAKLIYIELIYLNKMEAAIADRIERTEGLVQRLTDKFESGESNALDLNKATIHLLGLKSQYQENETAIKANMARLMALNGGNPVVVPIIEYAFVAEMPPFEKLLEEALEVNPEVNALKSGVEIYQLKGDLAKANRLPQFEVGYHYQSVLGQTFNGGHLGMSIPLWQQKNTVQAAKAMSELGNYELDAHKTQFHYTLLELYNRQAALAQTLIEYEQALNTLNTVQILDQLLELGDINYITYVQELEYYHVAQNDYLQTQKELQVTRAKLLKYQL